MNASNPEASLAALKENYHLLSHAYRRGELEGNFRLTTEEGFIDRVVKKFRRAGNTVLVRHVAAKLFEQAQGVDESYKERANLDYKVKEQLAEYKIRAQTLAYEISDYFLTTNRAMFRHFERLAHDAADNVKSYYETHYPFVVTGEVKVNIVKQVVLGVLSGVTALYRSYDTTKFAKALMYVDDVIKFLQEDYMAFCDRPHTAYGLLGLAYFLKGKLLLGVVRYSDADDCFRLSAENYIKKLPNKAVVAEKGTQREEDAGHPDDEDASRSGATQVTLAEMLALRRAAQALAFGSGYTALINSRVKEANRLITLARGVLHFNSLPIYAAYTELLYWSAKRAEHSDDDAALEEAKRGMEVCREVFDAQVPDTHYPHRVSIEHALVLHYLAQRRPEEKAAYYREAVEELKAAANFARGDGEERSRNRQLLAEACYILSHILRYQSHDLSAERSVELLREAFKYAKEAERETKNPSRHKSEALLALCGVYAEAAKHNIPLSELDPRNRSNASPASLSRAYACKVLEVNDGANNRISAVCYLRLVDHYLKNPHTHARAESYWKDWLKIRDTIEHGFVHEWAARTEAELDATKARTLVIDFADVKNIDQLRDEVNAAYARHAVAAWVQDVHRDYKFKGDEIIKKNVRKRGPKESLQTMLESFLETTLKVSAADVKEIVEKYKLFDMAKNLMESYMHKE